jgi:hypothetical protein
MKLNYLGVAPGYLKIYLLRGFCRRFFLGFLQIFLRWLRFLDRNLLPFCVLLPVFGIVIFIIRIFLTFGVGIA